MANASMLDGECPDIEYILSKMSQRDAKLPWSDEVRALHEVLKNTEEERMKIEQARAVIMKNPEGEMAERQAALKENQAKIEENQAKLEEIQAKTEEIQAKIEESQAKLEESKKKNKQLEEMLQRYRNAYGDLPS